MDRAELLPGWHLGLTDITLGVWHRFVLVQNKALFAFVDGMPVKLVQSAKLKPVPSIRLLRGCKGRSSGVQLRSYAMSSDEVRLLGTPDLVRL